MGRELHLTIGRPEHTPFFVMKTDLITKELILDDNGQPIPTDQKKCWFMPIAQVDVGKCYDSKLDQHILKLSKERKQLTNPTIHFTYHSDRNTE